MLAAYVAAGFAPGDFWSLTPGLYRAQMEGARDRDERAFHTQKWVAWHIAALGRMEKLPSFEDFATPPAKKKPDIQNLIMAARAMHEQFKDK